MKKAVLACCSAVALVLVISGCGGSSGGGQKLTPTAAFQKEAGAICKATHDKLVHVGDGVKNRANPSQADLAASVAKIVADLTEEHTKLAAVTPPANLAAGYATMLKSIAKVTTSAKRKGVAFVNPSTRPFDQSDADARAVGLTDCVS